jgi:diguanylate cyclase (GGDEF)-like protein
VAAVDEQRNTWGIGSFLIGVALSGVVWYLWSNNVGGADPQVRTQVLVSIGGAGAIMAAWFGHASYPRVANFKVYAMSITIALVAALSLVVLFGLSRQTGVGPAGVPAAIMAGYASVLFVLLVTVIIPEYLEFRLTRSITVVLVGLILGVFVAAIAIEPIRLFAARQLLRIRLVDSTAFWTMSAVAVSILLLSLFTEADSLGIGGVHAGAVILLSVGWLIPESDELLFGMVLAALALHIAVGTLIHWFRRLENRASYDPLLRIYNRGWSDSVLREQTRLDVRPPFGIALIDLDHFKLVNDTHGHDAGDAVLRESAQRIRATNVPRGSIARYGGEELIVFLPGFNEEEAGALLERVRLSLSASPIPYKRTAIPVTCSIGFSIREENDQPLEAVLKAADRAVYAAKDGGRNQVRAGHLRRRSSGAS